MIGILDHPALLDYNKTKLTEQWTNSDRQRSVMVLMMMLKIDLAPIPCPACPKEKNTLSCFIIDCIIYLFNMKNDF